MSLAENIYSVKEQISKAALSVNKDPNKISLIAVTKDVPPSVISQALDLGISHIGESRVDQFLDKYSLIDRNINYHLIGSLQTNKVKAIIDRVGLIHSIDRISLVKELNKRAESIDRRVKGLVQVNISKEKAKSGVFKEDLLGFIEKIVNYPYVEIQGLMTIAPLTKDKKVIRECFSELRYLFDDLRERDIDNIQMKYLSMGMSNDFEIAIEEGATMIRVGTAIFGERNYVQ